MLYAHTNINDYYGPEGTFILEPPTKEELEICFKTHANKLMIIAGLSIKSKHDKFIKSVGREKAIQRKTTHIAELVSIQMAGTKHVYYFLSEIKIGHKEYAVHFALTTVFESEQVKLIKCSIY
jgi:hypothetical protein